MSGLLVGGSRSSRVYHVRATMMRIGIGSFQKSRPYYGAKILGLSLEGHPQKGPRIQRNSDRILIRINSKPALYQPQLPLKEPFSYFLYKGTEFTVRGQLPGS